MQSQVFFLNIINKYIINSINIRTYHTTAIIRRPDLHPRPGDRDIHYSVPWEDLYERGVLYLFGLF